MDVAVHVMLM